jgi:hypothetical protein
MLGKVIFGYIISHQIFNSCSCLQTLFATVILMVDSYQLRNQDVMGPKALDPAKLVWLWLKMISFDCCSNPVDCWDDMQLIAFRCWPQRINTLFWPSNNVFCGDGRQYLNSNFHLETGPSCCAQNHLTMIVSYSINLPHLYFLII